MGHPKPMNEDKVIQMLLSHEERLVRIEDFLRSEVALKSDFETLVGSIDYVLKHLKRHDDELTMIGHRLDRIVGILESHDHELAHHRHLPSL